MQVPTALFSSTKWLPLTTENCEQKAGPFFSVMACFTVKCLSSDVLACLTPLLLNWRAVIGEVSGLQCSVSSGPFIKIYKNTQTIQRLVYQHPCLLSSALVLGCSKRNSTRHVFVCVQVQLCATVWTCACVQGCVQIHVCACVFDWTCVHCLFLAIWHRLIWMPAL